ncbi:MAG: tetratricopeptide repeat protein, partial [Myxococcota bacterium]
TAEAVDVQRTAVREAARALDDTTTLRVTQKLAELALSLSQPEVAAAWVDTARMLSIRLGVDDELEGAHVDYLEGKTLLDRGEGERALEKFDRALRLRTAALGPAHPAVARVLNGQGRGHGMLGDLDTAAAKFQSALDTSERALGGRHPEVAIALTNMAALHRRGGHWARALALSERVMAIKRDAFGENHVSFARALSNLGTDHGNTGDMDLAVELGRQALAIQERARGPDHPETASFAANLARDLMYRGDLDDALTLGRRAWQVMKATRGASDVRTGRSALQLATILVEREDNAGALPLLREAASTFGHNRGTELELAATELAMGHALRNLHQAGAGEAYDRSAAALRVGFGPDTPRLWLVWAGRSLLAIDEERYDDAVEAAERAIALQRELAVPDTGTADTWLTLATALAERGLPEDQDRAKALATRAREALLAASHDRRARYAAGLIEKHWGP